VRSPRRRSSTPPRGATGDAVPREEQDRDRRDRDHGDPQPALHLVQHRQAPVHRGGPHLQGGLRRGRRVAEDGRGPRRGRQGRQGDRNRPGRRPRRGPERVKGATLGRLTKAEIRIKTVLGRKYVQLDPAGDGTLDPSSEIPVSRTTSPFDIAPAFQKLAGTVGNIDGAQLGKAFSTLADDFRDSPKDVRASLDGLSRLSMTIASRDAQLKLLLQKARGVTGTLAARDHDLVSLLKDSDLIFQEVQARREAIHHLLVSTTMLSEQLVALVQENIATLAPALHSLRSVVTVLRNNQDNLDRSIAQLAPFVRLFANNLGNGRWFDTFVQNETTPVGFGPGSFGSP